MKAQQLFRASVIALGLAFAVPAAGQQSQQGSQAQGSQQGSEQQGSQQQSAAGGQSAPSREDNNMDWGWLGLLGLIGLAGLRRRDRYDGGNRAYSGSRTAT